MKRCLLIGGAGFIGQNLALALAGSYEVTVVDRAEGLVPAIAGVEYHRTDFFSDGVADELLAGADCVILLACTVGPKTSMECPELCYRIDVISLNRLLAQMKRLDRNRLVFISSGGTVYGEHEEELLHEEMNTYPINHYGIMKLTQEKIILMYNSRQGMDNVIFRLSNPYGAGQRVSTGIGAVTAILNSVITGEKIHIWGDGSVVRDYIYIGDAVEMMKRFLACEGKRQDKNAVYNVGTGIGTKLNELIRIVEEVTGRKTDVVYEKSRVTDVSRNVLDNAKIKAVIGEYQCLSVREGVEKYYRLHCSRE